MPILAAEYPSSMERDLHDGDIRSKIEADSSKRVFYRKWWFWGVVAGGVGLVALLGTTIAFLGSGGSSTAAVGTSLPGPDVEDEVQNINKNELAQTLKTMYTERGMDFTVVEDETTFQGRAIDFVAGSELYSELTTVANVERYALSVFYLATFRQPHPLYAVAGPWTSAQNWLTNESVCLWEGVECNSEDRVVGLLLPNHGLSGSLPLELSLLISLATIDFTTNFIFMDDAHHGLWEIMPTLRELTMDDNYFISETGLPSEFYGLVSIEKISLSYNLLQGTFDGSVFVQIPSLIHLELESNYISGPLPTQLLSLPNLVYLYIRRNSLEFDIADVFAVGNLPSAFAIWLDGNTIIGQLPSEIGLFTELASLSITDSSLQGSIPTQVGELVNLRRVWLYNNELTGPIPKEVVNWEGLQVFEIYGNEITGIMPEPVCNYIATSSYEFRTLSADCSEITCDNCCTTCY